MKPKTSVELLRETVDKGFSGAYSKMKELKDYIERFEKDSIKRDNRRVRLRIDKREVEKLERELGDTKHQLEILIMKRDRTT